MTTFGLSQPLELGAVSIRNRVFLAPMSGVTDLPFRQRAHRHGAGLVVSEMIASAELARGRSESERRVKRPDIDVHMVQLAGCEPQWLAEGARVAEHAGADIIDINMGCPAKKVTGGYAGSALMRAPDHALRLIEAVVAAVSVPVTVKMRLGWDHDLLNAPDIARRAEQAGVAMITVHGRTRCQFYKGRADWKAIRKVREAVSIPLVANGDVQSVADAKAILLESGADALMVGRAHYGAPWLAGAIAAHDGAKSEVAAVPETRAALADYVVEHYEAMLSLYGVERGLRHARKHIGWYLDRFTDGVDEAERKALLTGTDIASVIRQLKMVFTRPCNRQPDRLVA